MDHSAYANMAYGHSYYDYILEVYDYVHQIFPLSKKRDDNFIAGHSMGGYGTICINTRINLPKLYIICCV